MAEDFIALRRMVFYGFHGNKPEEQSLGQRFIIDVVLTMDLSAAGASDVLDDTVDYSRVYSLVKRIVEGPSLNLLEALGYRICSEILQSSCRIESVETVVGKPGVPLNGVLDGAEVRIVRHRYGS